MVRRVAWYKIGEGKTAREKVFLRRKRLEGLMKKKWEKIGCFALDPERIEGRNLENMIGAVQVPLGVAGPLKIFNSQFSSFNDYYVPLATTEGALVASVNRGCKAIFASGGCEVGVELMGASRGPIFRVKGLREGKKLIVWLEKNFNQLKRLVEAGEQHIKLLQVKAQLVGRNVFVRLRFDTDEAMGMNMVTMAAEKVARLIEKQLGVECVSLSGNFCVDKKPSWLNFVLGRGKQVWAETVVPKEMVKKILKTTAEKIAEVVYRKQLLGSAMSGSMGFNGHYANIVAAVFLATGQDMAHVVEGSLGMTTAEVIDDGDLYFSVYLPDLMVGTVGGGTGLATQQEALGILGFDKGKKGDALQLAGVIGGAVLAGELSLTAALASGDLARAHQKFGRGK
jgi:hydroxymethylglutaryl-CoA reductase (NADPH)